MNAAQLQLPKAGGPAGGEEAGCAGAYIKTLTTSHAHHYAPAAFSLDTRERWARSFPARLQRPPIGLAGASVQGNERAAVSEGGAASAAPPLETDRPINGQPGAEASASRPAAHAR